MKRYGGFIGLALTGWLMSVPVSPAIAPKVEDNEWFKNKSPEEVAWYKQISKSALEQISKSGGKDHCYAYVQDAPKLPRVLLIGDSISMNYTVPVRELLKGKANIHRIPTNGSGTKSGVQFLDQWLGNGKWDVIHFNWGIHDLARIKDNGQWDIDGKPASNPELYEKNLRALVKRLQATKAKLIWAATTQIPEGAAGLPANGEIELNLIAEKIMKENNIPIDDLHAHLAKDLAKFQLKQNVHFDQKGSEYLAESVAASILKALGEKKDGK